MNLQQFINQWNGKYVPSRGGITGQCVSLVQQWAEVNGVTGAPVFPVAGAKDMPNTRADFFTWVPNTPTGVPPEGAIIVWDKTWGGGWGHTAVVLNGANVNNFSSFEQNNPTGSGAHVVFHPNYSGVQGWLTLKAKQGVTEVATTVDNIKDLYRTELGREAGDDEARMWAGQPWPKAYYEIKDSPEGKARTQAVANAIAAVPALQKQVADLQKQVAEVTKQYQDLLNKPNTPITESQAVDKVAEIAAPSVGLFGKIWQAIQSKLGDLK